ncbi:hypothetical protein [Hyphomonas sp.]|nr:hypothetical protein [Hyphomonas sp.]
MKLFLDPVEKYSIRRHNAKDIAHNDEVIEDKPLSQYTRLFVLTK